MQFGAIRFGSIAVAISVGSLSGLAPCQTPRAPRFNVLAFYTGRHDLAHISFVDDANRWFPATARRHNFRYESTTDWSRLNADSLNRYQVVVFLDTRPDNAAERDAFRSYMERGGAWLGFHFSAFALTPSDYPQNWDWYHNEFLGAGQYVSNTWRPTSAVLRVDAPDHPVVAGLPRTFRSAPNEWYRWERDVRKTRGIRVLLSIDPSSFPLGTGPKPHEIWHSGDYPVVWTNTHYRMVYMNMGHNDMDYEHGTNRQLSSTFVEPVQNELIVRALRWLGEGRGDRLRDVRAKHADEPDKN
jgi:hypothetical protein